MFAHRWVRPLVAVAVLITLLGVPHVEARPATEPEAATETETEAPAPSTGYIWPVLENGDHPRVVHEFEAPPQPWLAGHRGVDLAAPAGAPVRAAAAGIVAFAGPVAGRPVISIVHADGLRTTYEPVIATLQAGDAVDGGEVIGHLATIAAHCTPTCLHWGVRRGEDHYLDPLLLVSGEPVIRLYPPAQG